MDSKRFLEYIRAFNAQDYDAQHGFYADDVQLVLPDPAIPPLVGKDGILCHYGPIHSSAKETVVPIIVLCDRNKVYFEMETYFQYQKEVERAVHDYHVYPGDVIKITTAAIYDIDSEGKMKKITCHLYNQELLGQVDLKEKIKDSESRADADLRLYNY